MKDIFETYVDLHMHTQASDGTWAPDDVIENVKKAGIDTFAVTDHDAIDNVRETQMKAERSGLRCVTGVELSTTYQQMEFHVLAYNFKLHHPVIQERINKNKKQRLDYHLTVIERLKDDYKMISIEEFSGYEYDLKRGGWPSLNYLLDRGVAHSMQHYFNLMKDYDLQLVFDSPSEIIDAIKASSGIAVLAHPAAYVKQNRMTIDALREWQAFGIQGLECYSPYYKNASDSQFYINYCKENNLYISGGSDCHGELLPQRKLRTPSIQLKDLTLPFLFQS